DSVVGRLLGEARVGAEHAHAPMQRRGSGRGLDPEPVELRGLGLRQQRDAAGERKGAGPDGGEAEERHGFTFTSSAAGLPSAPAGLRWISLARRASDSAAFCSSTSADVICGRPLLAKSEVGPCSLATMALRSWAASLASWAASAMFLTLRLPSV